MAALIAVAMLLCAVPQRARAAATLTVINRDDAGEGFNDPAPLAPVGGNDGTTLGEQRLIAFRYAAELWAAQLDSAVAVRISAQFDALQCDAASTTLGVAGPVSVFSDFAGAPLPDTWYPSALADKLAGMDLEPGEDDIDATFNSAFGTTCAFPAGWYYGLDAMPPNGDDSDFVTVVLHELGHGLGFLSFIDVESGRRLDGKDDVFSAFLLDNRSGKTFPDMSNAERASASLATGNLQWSGPSVVALSGDKTAGVDPSGRVEMYAPSVALNGSSVSHWSDEVRPVELLAPFLEIPLHDVGLALPALDDIGWTAPSVSCHADCNADGQVTIDELIIAVRIALGEAGLDACDAADTSGNGAIEVNELVSAVGRALSGCPVVPTPTHPSPPPTGTPTEPPVARCPSNFLDDSLGANQLCLYAGRWNASCGGDGLEVSFATATDGGVFLAAVAGDRLIGIIGRVTSATGAELQGWFTDFDNLSDLKTLAGTATLADDGATLRIDPDTAPFSVAGCDFAAYAGSFLRTVEGEAARAALRRLL
jgi:hypothetical protein